MERAIIIRPGVAPSPAERMPGPALVETRRGEHRDWLLLAFVKVGCFRVDAWNALKLPEFSLRFGERPSNNALKEIVREVEAKASSAISGNDDKTLEGLLENGVLRLPYYKNWANPQIRIAITKALVEHEAEGEPRKLKYGHYEKHGVHKMLTYCTGVHGALVEAGYDLKPWEMDFAPNGFYTSRTNRIGATKDYVGLKGGVGNVDPNEFDDVLRGLTAHTGHSVSKALREAGYRKLPWQKRHVRGFFKKRENRLREIIQLAKKMAKLDVAAMDITATHFHRNGLAGMLKIYYHDSPFDALLDAGRVSKEDEAYMRSPGHAHVKVA